jgi:tetratricopeptide (TPR) repeat protein
MWKRSLLVFLVIVGVAAVSPAAKAPTEEPKYPAEVLMSGEILDAASDPPELVGTQDVLALSDEMRQFIRANVNPGATDVFKLQQLIDAIMGKTTFDLEYDENTRTASETFHRQLGNCLSFSTMFVSLARGAGLKVDYQEVDIPPDWSMRKDVFVLNRHINVSVDLGAAGIHVVDFNISDFKTTYDVREISDQRGIAHFFNNLGVEKMQFGDTVSAFACFRRAIVVDEQRFSPAWTNLGTLYRRNDLFEYAEAAYLHALKADPRDTVAMSNLVRLYSKLGEGEKAEVLRKRVHEHRLRNPYYLYLIAREAFFDHEYDTAIDYLKQAIRKQDNRGEFQFLLGLCHLMKGDEEKAKKWMTRGEKATADFQQRKRFSTKIDTLLTASEKVD